MYTVHACKQSCKEMHVGLHVIWSFQLISPNKRWNYVICFHKAFKYEVHWISVRWFWCVVCKQTVEQSDISKGWTQGWILKWQNRHVSVFYNLQKCAPTMQKYIKWCLSLHNVAFKLQMKTSYVFIFTHPSSHSLMCTMSHCIWYDSVVLVHRTCLRISL
jgi:hypothetical protein